MLVNVKKDSPPDTYKLNTNYAKAKKEEDDPKMIMVRWIAYLYNLT